MSVATQLSPWPERFDSISVRERALIVGALLAIVTLLWDSCLMQPLKVRQQNLLTQLDATQQAIRDINAQLDASGANDANLQRQFIAAKAELETVNHELAADAAGLIAPQRMSAVLYDVLRQQQAVKLVRLRNLPAEHLLAPAPKKTDSPPAEQGGYNPGEAVSATPVSHVNAGPYLHPVELVIEGRYLDVLAYTRALEALPWRFYWKRLDVDTHYPLSRVRIELCTLSLDADWLGV